MIELPIKPFTRPAAGSVSLPGSKSITNRALILAALSDGPVTLRNALFSDDTLIMLTALKKLGFNISADEKSNEINIVGLNGDIPCGEARLHVGNAGTAARFLTAFICLKDKGNYYLDSDDAMKIRPMEDLLNALVSQGVEVDYEGKNGHFPFKLKTHRLIGGRIEIDASASSQFLSALLMVAPFAFKDTTIETKATRVRKPYVYLTERMMNHWGQSISSDNHYQVTRIKAQVNYHYDKGHYDIEPDTTAASYFIVLPLLTDGEVKVKGFNLDNNLKDSLISQVFLQGDTRFIDVMENANLISYASKGDIIFHPGSSNKGIEQDFNEFSDTFLTLAAISPLLEGKTRITGIGHTRHQETDRISAMAAELRKLGQKVIDDDDSLEIHPNRSSLIEKAQNGVTIETYNDHRIAMSFAILGCANLLGSGKPWLRIKDPYCCAKTFPRFFDVLERLRIDSLQ
jgi:3-phosphoshikimate 1-carboxyvinyltransferase